MADNNELNIVVNGRPKKITATELSFDDVIRLAFDNPPSGPDVIFTVAYRNDADHSAGTLAPGQSVKVRNGTVFNVTATNKS